MTKNIYQRLNAVMRDVSFIGKDGKAGGGMNYKFASHDAVTSAVRGPMVEHGVVYHLHFLDVRFEGNRLEARGIVRFVNIEEPTDYIDVPTFGLGVDNSDKHYGKAASYMVKYALLKTLGLETGDDVEKDNIDYVPGNTEPVAPKAAGKAFPKNEKKWS